MSGVSMLTGYLCSNFKHKIWVAIVLQHLKPKEKYNKPVEFKHRLQSHPAIIKLQLFFEKLVSRKIVIPKVVLDVGVRNIVSAEFNWLSQNSIVNFKIRITSICRATLISSGDISSFSAMINLCRKQ